MSTLLVTGGTGFFGKALLRHWKSKGSSFSKIFILSRNPKSFLKDHSALIAELNVEFIQGDILKVSAIKLNENIDYVIHAATDSTIGPSLGRLEVFNQIVKGTEEVLKFAVNHHCRRFLLTSSGAVYGPQPQDMDKIPESYMGGADPLNPNNAYGLGKRSAEHLCALYSQKFGFSYVVARCFAFVGVDLPLNAHFAIGNFIKNALEDSEIVIKGTGIDVRSYMAQSDLAMSLELLLINETNHNVFNVGSDKGYRINDIALLVRDIINPKVDIIVQGKKLSNSKSSYIPDISRLKEMVHQCVFSPLEYEIKLIQKSYLNKKSV